jgi:hypothetical protein
MTAAPALWKCPKCGQRFVTPRMWHSCARLTTAQFFAGKPPQLKALYSAFLAFVRMVGPVTVNVNKTRISFQGRVRFAGVAGTRKNALVCSFWLKRRIHSLRFSRVETIPPHNYVYHFHLTHADELDLEVERWIREAYAVGTQRSSLETRRGRPRQARPTAE